MFFPFGLAISSGFAWLVLDDFNNGNWKLYLYILGVYHIVTLIIAYIEMPPSPRYLIYSN